jgi:hypothetical protein
MKCILWCAGGMFVVITAGAEGQSGSLPADSLERARTWGRWFQEGKADSLFAAVAPGIRGALASRDALAAAQGEFAAQTGRILGVEEERFVWRGGNRQYWRTLSTERAPEPIVLRFVVRPDGRIHGFGLSLVSQVPPIDSGGPVIRRS